MYDCFRISVNADDQHRDAIVRAGALSLISKEVGIKQLHEAIVESAQLNNEF